MKTITFRLSLLFILLQLKTLSQLSFSLTYLSLTTSITCVNPAVIIQAQSNYTGAITYSVVPAAYSPSNSVFVFTTSATYTITGSAPGQNNFTATLSVSQNTTAPTSTLTPLYQLITCTTAAVQSMTGTALSPTTNVYHHFHFNNGLSVGPIYGSTATVQAPPGTHTYIVTDAINGCTVAKTFTVASAPGFPSFTVVSPIQNFSIGCVPKHTVDINIINAQSDPPNLPLTYTILPPGASTNIIPGPITSFTYNLPGTYTVVVKDLTSGCETRSPFSINQNTLAPSIYVSAPIRTLSCFVPTATLSGFSYNNVTYAWYSPIGVVQSSVYTASVTAAPSNTLIGNYTLVVSDLNNACKSSTLVPLFQNIFKPNAIMSGSNALLTCSAAITLTNNSTSGIPPSIFTNTLPIVVTQWAATTQASLGLSNTYTVASAGIYSMQIQDQNNGCTNTATAAISVSGASITLSTPAEYTLGCPGTNTVTIQFNISSFVTCNYTLSTSNAVFWNGFLSANSGTASVNLPVNAPDYYTLMVQEGICSASLTIPVYACVGINERESGSGFISIYPNPSSSQFEVLIKENTQYPILIEVFNSLSQKIKSQEIIEANTLITIDSAPGVYFISISKDGRRLHYSKLLKN